MHVRYAGHICCIEVFGFAANLNLHIFILFFSAKLNASVNISSLNTSVTSSRLKPNTNRLALVRPLSGVGLSMKNTTDLSNGRLKPGAPAKAAGNKSASVSVFQPQTPVGKIQRQTSAPNLQRLPLPTKMESAVTGTNPKPKAKVVPTPTSRLKFPQKQDGKIFSIITSLLPLFMPGH